MSVIQSQVIREVVVPLTCAWEGELLHLLVTDLLVPAQQAPRQRFYLQLFYTFKVKKESRLTALLLSCIRRSILLCHACMQS